MLRIIALVVAVTAIAALAATYWIKQRGGSDDIFAKCREGQIAGGTPSIGGPFTLVSETGETVTEKDVIDYCRQNLAHFKCPKTVVFTDLPKTSTGKVQKFKLREQAEGL